MKPPSANSGVRSSCDAVATNARRAESSRESWSRACARTCVRARRARRRRPSSTGSSKAPCAIRSAACSSRRIRRACTAAAELPSAVRSPVQRPLRIPAGAGSRVPSRVCLRGRTRKSTTTPSLRPTAISAYCTPRRVTRPRSTARRPAPCDLPIARAPPDPRRSPQSTRRSSRHRP